MTTDYLFSCKVTSKETGRTCELFVGCQNTYMQLLEYLDNLPGYTLGPQRHAISRDLVVTLVGLRSADEQGMVDTLMQGFAAG